MMTLIFTRKVGKPFTLSITETKINNNSLSLDSINKSSDKNIQFETIYKSWEKDILLDNPECYILNNLANITGSLDMAEWIFKSHRNPNQYIIDVNDINQLINFKKKKIKEYLKIFLNNYDEKCYSKINETYYLTFEGFNKYLLNIECLYLKSFGDKELINTMYYNITTELINCYQELYNYSK